jgi:hypothetical protein
MDASIFEAGASATAPTPPVSPSTGYPSNGNEALGIVATIPGAFSFYQILSELDNVIIGAGFARSTSDLTQLRQAIIAQSAWVKAQVRNFCASRSIDPDTAGDNRLTLAITNALLYAETQIKNAITSAGLTLDLADLTQLWQAIAKASSPLAPTVYAAPGSYTYTIPAGRSAVRYKIWGAGSGGGCGTLSQHGEGGSGGAFMAGVITAPAGTTVAVVVGAGSGGMYGTGDVTAGGDTALAWTVGGVAHSVTAGGARGPHLVSYGGLPGAGGACSGTASIALAGQRGVDGGLASSGGLTWGLGGASPFGGVGGQINVSDADGKWPGGGGSAWYDGASYYQGAGANGGCIFET